MIILTYKSAGNNQEFSQELVKHLLWDDNWESYVINESWKVPTNHLGKSGIIYGAGINGTFFCDHISSQMNWKIYQNSPSWVADLPDFFLKRNVDFMKVADVYRSNLSKSKVIRTADGFKRKPVKIDSGREISKFGFAPYSIDEGVLVSDDIDCLTEASVLVSKEKVVQIVYNYGISIKDEDPTSFVETLLRCVDAAPSFVLDIGYIRNRGWAVLDHHPVWAYVGANKFKTNNYLNALMVSCEKSN